jgi:hypothetical protein
MNWVEVQTECRPGALCHPAGCGADARGRLTAQGSLFVEKVQSVAPTLTNGTAPPELTAADVAAVSPANQIRQLNSVSLDLLRCAKGQVVLSVASRHENDAVAEGAGQRRCMHAEDADDPHDHPRCDCARSAQGSDIPP